VKVALVATEPTDRLLRGRLGRGLADATLIAELAQLAAACSEAGFEAKIFDGRRLPGPDLVGAVHTWSPDVVIVASDDERWPTAVRLVPRIARSLAAPVVLTGPFARQFPEHALEACPSARCVIVSAGPDAAIELLDRFALGSTLAGVGGVARRAGEQILPAMRRPSPADPPVEPDLHAVRCSEGEERPTWPPIGLYVGDRSHRLDAVVLVGLLEEIAVRWPERPAMVLDPTLPLDDSWIAEAAARVSDRKRTAPWSAPLSVGGVTPWVAQQLAEAGCGWVDLNLGSLAEDHPGKDDRTVAADAMRAVQRLHERGIRVRCRFVVGAPGSSPRTIPSMVDFALHNKIDEAAFSMYRPEPGSKAWKKLGWGPDSLVAAEMKPERAVFLPAAFTSLGEVEAGWRAALTRFYGSPRWWMRPGGTGLLVHTGGRFVRSRISRLARISVR